MAILSCTQCGRNLRTKLDEIHCRGCGNKLASIIPYHHQAVSPKQFTGAGKQLKSIGFFNRIQTKLSVIIAFLTVLILVSYGAMQFYTAKARMDTELQKYAENKTESLSEYLIDPVWDIDNQLVSKYVAYQMKDKHVLAILVWDEFKKKNLAGKTRDLSDPSGQRIIDTTSEIQSGYYKKEVKDIKRGDKKVGTVSVYITNKFMEAELYSSLINLSIVIFILIVCIFITIYFSIKRAIVRPIRQLTAVTEKMSMGDLDVAVDTSSRNEMGILAQAILRMQTSLKIAMRRIEKK